MSGRPSPDCRCRRRGARPRRARPRCGRASAASAARARARPGRPRARARSATPSRSRSRRRAARTRGWGSPGAPCGARRADASAVLADADRVVRPDPERLHVPERREPDRGPHVVGEDQEGRAVGLEHPLRQPDPVHDRAHRVLADPEGDVAAGVLLREEARASNSVFVDSTRSAAPPSIVGVNGFSACITVLGRRGWRRLARRELGERLDPARGGVGPVGVPTSFSPGNASAQRSNRCCHSCCQAIPCGRMSMCS